MHLETVTVDPEIIQLGRQDTQMIKITNKTSNHLHNFFFCLYNAQKFQFSPESFSLAPHQQKLIKVSLKLKSIKAVSKQFAYLKSAQTSQRITILINNTYQSPQPKIGHEEGYQDQYTLSSRDYKESQTAAFNKIINEKQAYITRLERQIKQASASKQDSSRVNGNLEGSFYKQMQMAQVRINTLERQRQILLNENMLIHQRFQQYKAICQRQFKCSEEVNLHLDAKKQEVMRLHEQIRRLQEQGSDFLRNLAQKQSLGRQLELKVKELQNANFRITEEIKNDNERRVRLLQQKLEEQKMSYQNSFRLYEGKIRQLQLMASSEINREQISDMQRQIQRVQKKLQQEKRFKIQTQTKYREQQQLQHSQIIKLQLINSQLTDKNGQLTRRVRQLEHQVERTKDQAFVKKSKVQKNEGLSSDKTGHYLQIALDSCKNQNEMLKKNHSDLQRAYTRHQESASQRLIQIESELSNKCKQIDAFRQSIQRLTKEKEVIQDLNHANMIKIKQQNLQLLEKIANSDTSKKIQKQLHQKQLELNSLKDKLYSKEIQIKDLHKENTKLQGKINKFKNKAQNQLRNINETAVQELKRVHDQKKQLAKRVVELEQSLQGSQNQKTRHKSRTGVEMHSQPKNNIKIINQGVEARKVGIKDQRRQLEESRAQSNCNSNSQQNVQHLWQQLGQLRQLDNYIKNEQERLGRIFGLSTYEGNQNGRSIFRAIKFFKQLEGKMREARQQIQNSEEAVKELSFLRGRLTELEALRKQNRQESLNLKERSGILNPQLMEFVRAQMRSQFKKLHDALKLAQQKHNLLKKKIYEQYRARLIAHLQKKQKNTIQQIQSTLERFIQGLSNLSHKEAVLAKEVRLKGIARKENSNLKEKLKELTLLLETKKGYCSRQPLRIWAPQSELDWQENLKLEAQLLTHEAQIHRLNDQLYITQENGKSAKQQLKRNVEEIQEKNEQIIKLKKHVIEIEIICQNEVEKILKQNQELKKKYVGNYKSENHKESKNAQKDKELSEIRKDLQTKKELIKSLKDREKMLQDLLESSNRSEQKQKKRVSQQNQRQEHLRQLKDSNRELRKQNSELKEKNKKLQQQINRKATYINNLRMDSQQNRIKIVRKQQFQTERLKDQIRALKDEIRRAKDQVDKISKLRSKQLEKIKNENQIQLKSFESIIRALLRSIRRIYIDIQTILKKKGKRVATPPDFEKMGNNPSQVNGLKIYEYFEQPLTLLESQ